MELKEKRLILKLISHLQKLMGKISIYVGLFNKLFANVVNSNFQWSEE